MILYFLCFAQLPYRNADIIDEDKEDLDILRAEISQWSGFDDARRMRQDLPEKLYSFLKRLLSVDPDKRPTAEEVLKGIQAGVAGANTEGLRVLPVDTPSNPSSTPRSPRSPNRNVSTNATGFPGGVPVLQPSSFQSDATESSAHETGLPRERHRSHSADHDLVLRATALSSTPRASQPQQRQPNNNRINSDNTSRTRVSDHLLLPPPSRPNRPSIFTSATIYRSIEKIISFSLLIVKVLSITQPCSPLAVNPWILYPLLCLAALDFAVGRPLVHAAAFVFHVVIVIWAVRSDELCMWMPETSTVHGI
ncbi:protein kinase [Histoplasma capsulatum G186AR]|nr:protein kinase [Histoplasma capsulatum G186AR]